MILINIIASQLKVKSFPVTADNIHRLWKAFERTGMHPEKLLEFLDDEELIQNILGLPYKKEVVIGAHHIIDRAASLNELNEPSRMVEEIQEGFEEFDDKEVIEVHISRNGEYVDHDEFTLEEMKFYVQCN